MSLSGCPIVLTSCSGRYPGAGFRRDDRCVHFASCDSACVAFVPTMLDCH